jgi:hypothetical protein
VLELAPQHNQDGELSWQGQRFCEIVCYSRRRGKIVAVSEGLFLGLGLRDKDKSGSTFQAPRSIISNSHTPKYCSALRVYSMTELIFILLRISNIK